MNVEITKVEIKIGERTLEFSIQEARDIHEQLRRLFNQTAVVRKYIPVPYTMPAYPPIIIDYPPSPSPDTAPHWPQVWCHTSTGNGPQTATACLEITNIGGTNAEA